MWYLLLFIIFLLTSGFLLYHITQRRKALRVFMYHHIGKAGDGNPNDYFVSDEMFAQQLDFLSANKYHPVSLSEVEDAYIHKTKLPERPVLLTFDDGYRNNYEYAYPLAVARKIPITIFLTVGEIGQKDEMLTWEQVYEMAASGLVQYASHGMNHKRLRELTDEEALAELTDSRTKLKEMLKIHPVSFCYPYGAFDKRVRKLVFRAGYQLDFGTRKGLNRWLWTGKRPFKREHIKHGQTLKDFKKQLH